MPPRRGETPATREQVAERGSAVVRLIDGAPIDHLHDSQTHLVTTAEPQTAPAEAIGEETWRSAWTIVTLPAEPATETTNA